MKGIYPDWTIPKSNTFTLSSHDVVENKALNSLIFRFYQECFADKSLADSVKLNTVVENLVGYFDVGDCQWSFMEVQGLGIVSTVTTIVLEDAVFIFNLATFPEHRGNGYASYLISQVASQAFKIKARVQGSVDRSNPFLLDFYKNMGAKEVQVGIYSENATPSPSVRLQCDLTHDIISYNLETATRKMSRSHISRWMTKLKTLVKLIGLVLTIRFLFRKLILRFKSL
mmetsp:Transcript_3609/g.4324  ORF Transcript_3609/g.4324 Transcript_3609/m.4324 type:complete len:228 (-) Transcript_3609:70-753(-)